MSSRTTEPIWRDAAGRVTRMGMSGFLMALAACGSTEGPPVSQTGESVGPVLATAFTNRLPAPDPETQAIVLTQTVYPATREENAVGAIILSPQDAATAFTAMHRVTHMPVNAPLLYLDRDGRLPERVKEEMKRLRPDGVVPDGQTQVYVLGNVNPSVAEEVRRELKFQVRTLYAPNPVELAEVVDRWQAAMKSDHPDEVVVSAIDHPEGIAHGIGAMGWNAHMGKGFGWVYRDSVPNATRRILQRRLGKAYIYITGGDDVVSEEVARELARYGIVRRIRGPNVYATNAVNAGYKDFGRNWGWWWDESPRDFGWGIAQAGHNFVIGSADDMLGMIPAAVLSHMGKHGPILLVARDSVPQVTRDYLKMVQPDIVAAPDEAILNFAFIIGDPSRVSWEVQRELTRLLSPTRGDSPQGVPVRPDTAATTTQTEAREEIL